jgi:signal transduction histidine kinase
LARTCNSHGLRPRRLGLWLTPVVLLLDPVKLRAADSVSGAVNGGLVLGLLFVFGAMTLALVLFLRGWQRRWRRRDACPVAHPLESLLQHAVIRTASQWPEDEGLVGLRLDLARTLTSWQGVALAAIATLAESRACGDEPESVYPYDCVICRPGLKGPRWLKLSLSSEILAEMAGAQAHEPFLRPGAGILMRSGISASLQGACDGCLVTPVAREAGPPEWILIVGLDAASGNPGPLAQTLQRLQSLLALILTFRHQVLALKCEREALRAKNATLRRFNELQNEFVAITSHELKTPLTSINAYTEVLMQNVSRPGFAQAQEFLGIIKEESERLLRLVNRILDFSRLELGQSSLNCAAMDVGPLIEETVQTLMPLVAQKDQHLHIECAPDLPKVDVDSDLIRQVIINLVNNAIKYTPKGGRITIRAADDAATVRVSVIDTGPGIPAAELQRIFGQFYRLGGPTRNEEGSGLGLAIVKNLINLHQGHIDVQSQEGNGATFSFYLPKQHRIDPAPVLVLEDDPQQPVFQQILRLCVRMIAEMMESRTVALLLLDPPARDLVVTAALGWPGAERDLARIDRQRGLAGRILREERTLRSASDPSPAAGEAASPEGAEIAAPVKVGGDTVGVIVAARKLGQGAYDQDDVYLMATLAEVISAALAAAHAEIRFPGRLAKVVEALQTMAMLKRSAIPTATPLALRLLANTAQKLDLSRAEIKRLQYIASMHDAGMVRVGDGIVLKPGELTPDERAEIGRHPEWGADLMAPLLTLPEMEEIILAHHERMDGTGYPHGRQGGEIPLGSRILAVIDAFFAMICERPYRAGLPPETVAQEIRLHAGSQFDPEVVDTFLAVLQAEGMLAAGPASAVSSSAPNWTESPKERRWQPQES